MTHAVTSKYAQRTWSYAQHLPDLPKNITSTNRSAVRSSSDQEVAQGHKMDELSSRFVYKSVAVVTVAFPAAPLLLARARICISAAQGNIWSKHYR
uniref:Uncharacterized protein n=1 Tax=Lactuca sativa TaxID=4236 RepID=A0A9R1VUE2_LACSA|nr:hypothetical protein LSAT_V11C400190140 [Lactuca sativa]